MIEAEWFDEGQGIYRKAGGFYKTCKRATPADIECMWRRLWGNAPHSYVKVQWDFAQERGNELMDMCEGLQINQVVASSLY